MDNDQYIHVEIFFMQATNTNKKGIFTQPLSAENSLPVQVKTEKKTFHRPVFHPIKIFSRIQCFAQETARGLKLAEKGVFDPPPLLQIRVNTKASRFTFLLLYADRLGVFYYMEN